jgi:MFS family permease
MNLARLAPDRAVPAVHRKNFIHLYLDIAWFGILNGSALSFISIYLVRLGATPFQIGLLNSGPALVALLLTLPAGRWLNRRPVGPSVFWSAVLLRLFYLIWIPLPALVLARAQVWTYLGLTLLMSIPGSALAVGFNALYAEAVPPQWRAHVAGIRNALLALTFTVTSLLCGHLLTSLPFPTGYQLVFGIGALGAALSSLHLRFVRPVPATEAQPELGQGLGDLAQPGSARPMTADAARRGTGLRFLTRLRRPSLPGADILRGRFGRICLVLFAFHLSEFLAVPLFAPYWVDTVGLSDSAISLGNALFFLLFFLGSTQLARVSSKLGHHRVTALGAALTAVYPALAAVTHEQGLYFATSILGGAVRSLLGGALANYLLESIPAEGRPAHLAWYNLALNAAILLGSLAGPLIAQQVGLAPALALIAGVRILSGWAILRWG